MSGFAQLTITKVIGVSFETPKDYMLQNFKMVSLSIRSWNLVKNHRITFHLCSYLKLVSPNILHFTKIKPLKSYEKYLLFHLNYSFGSCNIQILRENWEVDNGIIMTSWTRMCTLLTLIFGKTS